MEAPEPTTVWMVTLARGEVDKDVKGTLETVDDALVFTATKERTQSVFPFGAIRRAKRLRGSPVLMIEWSRDAEDLRRTAFYFTQPPPLYPAAGSSEAAQRTERVSAFPIRRSGKRRAQRVNTRYLQTVGINRKEQIQGWADAVNARRAPKG